MAAKKAEELPSADKLALYDKLVALIEPCSLPIKNILFKFKHATNPDLSCMLIILCIILYLNGDTILLLAIAGAESIKLTISNRKIKF